MDQRSKHHPRVSIVIPTLNEAENISPLLTRIFAVTWTPELSFEVVVVDDNSTDGTQEEVRKWQVDYPVRLLCRKNKDGLAGAVIEGARYAEGEIIVVMDADLSHPPEVLPELISPILAGTHDMVIGSRYTRGGSTPNWPLGRKIASRLATLPARILSDPNDPLAGFFAVGRHNLADLDTTVSGFKIGLEVLVAGEGRLRVTEVPITFYDRHKGQSKMNKRIIFEYLQQVLGLCGVRPRGGFAKGMWSALGLGVLVDLLVFFLLHRLGFSLSLCHMAGFTAAWITSSTIHCRRTFANKGSVGGIIVIGLLALVLRGGILGDLLRLGLSLAAAMPLSSLVSLALASLGLIFFVFADHGPDVKNRLFCLGVIGYALVLRLVYLGLPSLLEEEAYYWNYGRHLAMGYLDHPPMVALLNRLGTGIFGTREFGVRIAAIFCWMITAGFSYLLTRSLYDRLAAFRSVMLLSILPVFFFVGMMMTPDAPLTACWSALIYFLYRVFLLERPRAWLGVGIFLGLGMFSKYTIVLLGPAIVLFMLIDPKSRRWFASPWPYAAALISLVLFSPVIIWNAQHHWASFLFQSERRVTGMTDFATPVFLGHILLLLTPTGVFGFIAFLIHGRRGMEKRRFLFFLLLAVVPLSVFVFFSLSKEVKLNWTGPVWLAVVPYLAYSFRAGEDAPLLLRICRKWWPATIVTMLLFGGVFLQYYSLGIPGISTLDRPFLTGWQGLAGRIEQMVAEEEKRTGRRPIVVGMDKYRIASGLAFYRYKNAAGVNKKAADRAVLETTAWNVFGWNGLMYAYWFTPTKLEGKNMLLVGFSKESEQDKFFIGDVARTGPIQKLDVTMAGHTIDHCYVRMVYDYHH